MITTAIIAEFNPLHKGHEYLINKAKELTGADCVLVIMSGNFTQRGDIAIFNKWTRAKSALLCGCDIIIELPFIFATGSAKEFATGAVSILNSLGFIDYLCFGSECGDIGKLEKSAKVIMDEQDNYRSTLTTLLTEGLSYPAARHKAYSDYIKGNDGYMSSDDFKNPNNILAIEYICALLRSNSSIRPITVTRLGNGYNDATLSDSSFSSATSIRHAYFDIEKSVYNLSGNKRLDSSLIQSINNSIPNQLTDIYSIDNCKPVNNNDFIPYLGLSITNNLSKLSSVMDMSESLANKINNCFVKEGISMFNKDYEDLLLSLKAKDLTSTRIGRAMIHALLGLTQEEYSLMSAYVYTNNEYARILGLSEDGRKTINANKKAVDITLINSLGKSYMQLSEQSKSILNYDIKATNLYSLILYNKYKFHLKDDYRHNIELI